MISRTLHSNFKNPFNYMPPIDEYLYCFQIFTDRNNTKEKYLHIWLVPVHLTTDQGISESKWTHFKFWYIFLSCPQKKLLHSHQPFVFARFPNALPLLKILTHFSLLVRLRGHAGVLSVYRHIWILLILGSSNVLCLLPGVCWLST
jgi:hypothetical protein